MKKEDFVKLGVEEEVAKKLEEASLEELKGFIPKARFDEVNTAKNSAEALVKERDGQLEKLKNSTGDVEAMKKQIEDLQKANKEAADAHAAEIKQLKINNAVDAAITNAKGKNIKAIKALLNLENAELAEDGTVKGLSEQLNTLVKAEDSKFMFDVEVKKPNIKGAKPGESGNDDADKPIVTKEQFTKMSYKDRIKLFNEDKELYDSLTQNQN